MTTAERYRIKEASAVIQVARYIFNVTLKDTELHLLGDLLDEIKTGKTPSKREKKFYEDNFLDWYKPNEIGETKFCEPSKEKLSKYAFDKGQATIYSPNTILINAIGDVGRVSILTKGASSNQQITGIKPKEDKLNIEYCYYYLLANRHLFYKDLFRTTLPIVNQKKIKSFPIKLPSLLEQKNIVGFLNELENLKTISNLNKEKWGEEYFYIANKFFGLKENSNSILDELSHQLSIVSQLRQAFLREAMQGRLVEQDPSDEPASELLARIKAEKEQLIKEKKIRKQKPLPPIEEEEIPFENIGSVNFVRLGSFFSVEKGKIGIKKAVSGNVPLVVTGEERLSHNEVHFSGKAVIVPLISSTGHGHASLKRIHYQERDFAVGSILACIMPYLPEFFNMSFLYHYLDYYKEQLFVDKMKGAANVTLKISSIMETPIPFLSMKVQNRYEELIKICDHLEESIKNSQAQNEMLLGQVLREALEHQ